MWVGGRFGAGRRRLAGASPGAASGLPVPAKAKPPAFARGSYLIVPGKLLWRCTPVNGTSMKDPTALEQNVVTRLIAEIFQLIEWTLVTAAVAVAGVLLDSAFLNVSAVVLTSLVSLYAGIRAGRWVAAYRPPDKGPVTRMDFLFMMVSAFGGILVLVPILHIRNEVQRSELLGTPYVMQRATTPPTAPGPAGIPAPPASGSAAPKPASAPSAPTAPSPAPSAPPSAAPSRSSTPAAPPPR